MKSAISNLKSQFSNRTAPGRSATGFLLRCGLLLLVCCLLHSSVRAQEQININTASAAELMRLPGIGPTLAARIIEHRRKHGPFRRPQDIVIIDRMSARLYRRIAPLIRT
ncbi:MAG: helix-hairpin-helix domain-containing protein [Blastocatellia bacterium]